MKKTYITTMPDRIGAFLQASRCFASLGINITRVSYNKAVDSNTLFIDVEGDEEQLKEADRQLTEIGYLQDTKNAGRIVLMEFNLKNAPGSVTGILSLISEFNFNISYLSLQENGDEYQLFKMGLFIDDPDKISRFTQSTEKLCPVKVIEYDRSEKVYDNSIFYESFVSGISESLDLSDEVRTQLLINTNLAMQTLDEQGIAPYKAFDNISRIADHISSFRKEAFKPRISTHKITEDTEIIVIEPPCGSNTTIIKSCGEVLFVDSGYALYREEMEAIFRRLLPGYDDMKKRIFITHADVDHCGLLPIFDEIISSRLTARGLVLEGEGKPGYRDSVATHRPYINMCRLLTAYAPPSPDKITALWGSEDELTEPLAQTGFFDFGELHFEVYEGKGGHIPGETVLIDYEHHIAFTGDIYINMHGLTPEQAEYNRYAPVLMTSVDISPQLCALERKAVMQRLGAGSWQIFSGHGAKKDYSVNIG